MVAKGMNPTIARNFCSMKRVFYNLYRGGAHIQEIIPKNRWGGINEHHIAILHKLCGANPIYHNTYSQNISGVPCIAYEGDIGQYWLNSTKNPGSTQPFYPTWMLSALILALRVRESNYNQIIDVGSGDGRIAFSAKILGMDACSIEIDQSLVTLQKHLADKAGISLDIQHADATIFEYSSLGYDYPVLFTGGLPQMGDILALSVIQKLKDANMRCGVVLAGSYPRGMQTAVDEMYGWGTIIDKYDLKVRWTMELPTVWTFDQKTATPYICTTTE